MTAIDVFAGFGGSSQGIHASGADVLAAANHNAHAISVHSANFPDTEHYRCDLVDTDSADYVDPGDLPAARFAWFSPGCTHHSQANAKKLYQQGRQSMLPGLLDDEFDEAAYANSERSRVTMSCVLRYTAKHSPEIIVVENVVEVCHWGPGRDGTTFRWWLREIQNLGYNVEPLFLNSMFFPPTPQSRDRIYIVAWRKGNRRPNLDYRPAAMCVSETCNGRMVEAVQTWKPRTSAWPWSLERWGKYGAQYTYNCPHCRNAVDPVAWPAYTAIDWSNLGPSIAERREMGMKPLAGTTMERIRRGLAKFRNGPPVIIPAKSVWGVDRAVTSPFSTQTGQQDKAMAVADGMVIPLRTHGTPASIAEQLRTVVSGNVGHALVIKNYGSIEEAKYRAAHAGLDALGSVTTHPSEAIVTAGVVIPAAGNTHERPGQTRARSLIDQLFTQHGTQAFGFGHLPFLTEMRGGGSIAAGQRQVVDPAHTVTAGGLHHGVVSPGLFAKINGGPGDTAWHLVDEALNTVTGRDTHGLVVLPWVEQWRSDPVAVTEQLATVMTHLRHALAIAEPADWTTITDDDLEQVRFRMLDPDPELRRAMAFGDDYILLGNKTQVTAGLGNAVTPPVAAWVTERCLASLDPDPERV